VNSEQNTQANEEDIEKNSPQEVPSLKAEIGDNSPITPIPQAFPSKGEEIEISDFEKSQMRRDKEELKLERARLKFELKDQDDLEYEFKRQVTDVMTPTMK